MDDYLQSPVAIVDMTLDARRRLATSVARFRRGSPEDDEVRRRFRALRDRLNISRKVCAAYLGIHQQTLHDQEMGMTSMVLDHLLRLEMAEPHWFPAKYSGRAAEDVNRAADIRRRLQAGESLQSIGNDYGITRERVRQIANKHGVKWDRQFDRVKHRNRMCLEAKRAVQAERKIAKLRQVWEAKRLVAGGMSILKAIKAVGAGRGNLQYYLKGTPSRHGRWRPEIKQRQQNIIALHEMGLSARAIAELLSTHTEGVKNFLLRRGYQPLGATAQPSQKPTASVRPRRQRRQPRNYPTRYPRDIPLATEADASPHWPLHVLDCMVARWRAGASADTIAAVLGPPYTRNAVMGKIDRMREARQIPALDGAEGEKVAS